MHVSIFMMQFKYLLHLLLEGCEHLVAFGECVLKLFKLLCV